MHARYYNGAVGRFLSVDGVLGNQHLPQSWNRYTYVHNNPVACIDPDGNATAQAIYEPVPLGNALYLESRLGEKAKTMIEIESMAANGDPLAKAILKSSRIEATGGPVEFVALGWAAKAGGVFADILATFQLVSSQPPMTIESPSSFTGATPQQVRQSIPESWGPGQATRVDGGTRWANPNVRGEQIRIMPGVRGAGDPLHAGPYAVFSKGGQITRVPLAGNPVLQQSFFQSLMRLLE
jgi:uncharacterized protein RhaS with RHS repeats